MFFTQKAFCQNGENQIKRVFPQYTYQGNLYAKIELPELMKDDKAAMALYKKHKKARRLTVFCLATSIVLLPIGYRLDRNLYGQDVEKAVAAYFIGSVAEILVPIFYFKSRKRFKKSIRTFNENIKANELGEHSELELNLSFSGNGLGVVVNF